MCYFEEVDRLHICFNIQEATFPQFVSKAPKTSLVITYIEGLISRPLLHIDGATLVEKNSNEFTHSLIHSLILFLPAGGLSFISGFSCQLKTY